MGDKADQPMDLMTVSGLKLWRGYEPLRRHPSFLKPHMHCGNGA